MITQTNVRLEAAIAILARIEALPQIRRRGQPDDHREPVYQDPTERSWVRQGIFDESSGLLQLAARSALTVSRWQLRAAYYLARLNHDEYWASYINDFDKTFGNKEWIQLIELVEAIVHENMDVPALPIYPYRFFLPEWKEVLFGRPALMVGIKDRYAYVTAEICDDDSQHYINLTLCDYSHRKLVDVRLGKNSGCSSGGSGYERWHIKWLRDIIGRLQQNQVIRPGVADETLDNLLSSAAPDVYHLPQ